MDGLPTPVFLGFPGGSDSTESACKVGDLGSMPGLGRSTGAGHGNPLQYSGLENSMGVSLSSKSVLKDKYKILQICLGGFYSKDIFPLCFYLRYYLYLNGLVSFLYCSVWFSTQCVCAGEKVVARKSKSVKVLREERTGNCK